MEGTCSGALGYIIAVLEIQNPGRGKIVDGGAEFDVVYTAIVYRPFRGEVVDGVVGSVNKVSRRAASDWVRREGERRNGGRERMLMFVWDGFVWWW